MKNKILSILIVLYSLINSLSAQELNAFINAFDSEKAVWKSFPWGYPAMMDSTVLEGDTIIDGEKWKIIKDGRTGFIRIDGQKVIFRPENSGFVCDEWFNAPYNTKDSVILYDFSLEVGNSIHWRGGDKIDITEIDSILLIDSKHKRFNFISDAFIEGLGSASYPPLFILGCVPTGDNHNPVLVCCHVNDELLYLNPQFIDCDGNYVGNESIEPMQVRIYIANTILHIDYQDDNLFDVALFDMNGMLIKQQKKNTNSAALYLSGFTNGVYFIRITSGNKSYSQKIRYNSQK